MLIGNEHRSDGAVPGEEIGIAGGQQGPGGVLGAVQLPRRLEFDQEPFAVHRHRGIGGDVDMQQLAVDTQLVYFGIEEVGGPADQGAFEAGGVVKARAHHHVRGFAAENQFRIIEGLSALPALDQTGISRIRETVGPEIGAYEHGIGVDPTDLSLGLGQHETVRHELSCLQIEFAYHHGIGSAARQAHQRPVELGA